MYIVLYILTVVQLYYILFSILFAKIARFAICIVKLTYIPT